MDGKEYGISNGVGKNIYMKIHKLTKSCGWHARLGGCSQSHGIWKEVWISEFPHRRKVGQLSAEGMISTYLSQGKTLLQQLNLQDEKLLALLSLHARPGEISWVP